MLEYVRGDPYFLEPNLGRRWNEHGHKDPKEQDRIIMEQPVQGALRAREAKKFVKLQSKEYLFFEYTVSKV